MKTCVKILVAWALLMSTALAQSGRAIAAYFTSPVTIAGNVMENGNECRAVPYISVGLNFFTAPPNSLCTGDGLDPAFDQSYTQVTYTGVDRKPAGVDNTVWPVYALGYARQVTSDNEELTPMP